jgi:VWFA-related protein
VIALALLLVAWWPVQSADTIQVDVNLINIFVTVQDDEGRFVTDLDAADFRILEDGIEQPIEVFESEGGLPTSLGVLVDNSGSSAAVLRSVKQGLPDFIGTMGARDEAFVMSFGTTARIIHDFDEDPRDAGEAIDRLRPFGTSVLFDAVNAGIGKLRDSTHPRQALIVMTDGNDNGSRSLYTDVIAAAESNLVLLYFVGIGPGILVDTYTLNGLAEMTGGRLVLLGRDRSVADAIGEIRDDLGRQYYIAYHASAESGYHAIDVQVPGRNVSVRSRDGYRVD